MLWFNAMRICKIINELEREKRKNFKRKFFEGFSAKGRIVPVILFGFRSLKRFSCSNVMLKR